MAISLLFGLIVTFPPTIMGNVGWSMLSFIALATVAAETCSIPILLARVSFVIPTASAATSRKTHYGVNPSSYLIFVTCSTSF